MLTFLKKGRFTSSLKLLFLALIIECLNSCSEKPRDTHSGDKWLERDKWQKPELIIKELGIVNGDYVADIGFFEGYMTVKLAEHVGIGGRVFAVDINAYWLKKLPEKLQERDIDNVYIIEGDSDNPQLPKDELDAILILNTYHEMDQYASILSHVRMAMRDNGRLVIIEAISESLQGKSRSEQVYNHQIDINYVKEDLQNAGFQIQKEIDPFINRTGTKRKLWLLVAVKKRSTK